MIGVDADAASMRETSRKAARAQKKGGLPNAMFVVASVEALPDELHAIADEVRVTFPWGSLLRGVVGTDPAVLAGMALVAKPGAEFRALLSVTERDRLGVMGRVDRVAFDEHGLQVVEDRPATVDEIDATGSSWAKRLRAGADRPVTLVRAVRRGR